MGYNGIDFDDPIPKGYKILYTIKVAGLKYRLDNFKSFLSGKNLQLKIESEPNNKHDKNALKVNGIATVSSFLFFSSRKKFHLGYIPAEYAETLAPDNAFEKHPIRMRHIGIGDYGGKIEFQFLTKKKPK